MCVFFMDWRGCEGIGVELRMRPICTQVLRGPLKLCQVCGSTSWVGSRDFYAQIWELWRQSSHMGCMLDADWSRKFLLRCDWLGPIGDPITTQMCGFFKLLLWLMNTVWSSVKCLLNFCHALLFLCIFAREYSILSSLLTALTGKLYLSNCE